MRAALLALVLAVDGPPARAPAAFIDTNLAVSLAAHANGGGCYGTSLIPGLLDMLTLINPEQQRPRVTVWSFDHRAAKPVTRSASANYVRGVKSAARHGPGAVERPSAPPRSFRLRKGSAPLPVNCGSVPFHRSIALFWMRSGVSACCRSLLASACALALTRIACASPSASATFALASVCWRCSS